MLWLLVVACTLAGFAGCGGGDEGGTASNAGSGGGKNDSGTGGDATGGGLNIDGAATELKVEPATATLSVTAKGAPQSQAFKALVSGSQVSATWTLASYDIANIDAQGMASSTGITVRYSCFASSGNNAWKGNRPIGSMDQLLRLRRSRGARP